MIDIEKLDSNELAGIVLGVQCQEKYLFRSDDIKSIIRHTVRKADLNQKGESYFPVLFENELRDYVMRERINERWRRIPCAQSVCTALA